MNCNMMGFISLYIPDESKNHGKTHRESKAQLKSLAGNQLDILSQETEFKGRAQGEAMSWSLKFQKKQCQIDLAPRIACQVHTGCRAAAGRAGHGALALIIKTICPLRTRNVLMTQSSPSTEKSWLSVLVATS